MVKSVDGEQYPDPSQIFTDEFPSKKFLLKLNVGLYLGFIALVTVNLSKYYFRSYILPSTPT